VLLDHGTDVPQRVEKEISVQSTTLKPVDIDHTNQRDTLSIVTLVSPVMIRTLFSILWVNVLKFCIWKKISIRRVYYDDL